MQAGDAPFAEADYVIVGGGSAGAVLANRLSEDPGVSVALVEAGGEARSFLVQLPVGFLEFRKGRPGYLFDGRAARRSGQRAKQKPKP